MNWMRANDPPTTSASVSAASVLARPGTDSSRQWPRAQQADEQPLEQAGLADDHLAQLEEDALDRLRRLGVVHRCAAVRGGDGRLADLGGQQGVAGVELVDVVVAANPAAG